SALSLLASGSEKYGGRGQAVQSQIVGPALGVVALERTGRRILRPLYSSRYSAFARLGRWRRIGLCVSRMALWHRRLLHANSIAASGPSHSRQSTRSCLQSGGTLRTGLGLPCRIQG